MERETALSVLRHYKTAFEREYGVERIGIFGSIVRNEAGPESDIDVVVEMVPDLYRMVHIKRTLEAAFCAPVDLVRYRETMNPFLKGRIDREAVYA